jgi:hypothetical protein
MSANLEDLESDDFESEADNVTDIGSVKRRDTIGHEDPHERAGTS